MHKINNNTAYYGKYIDYDNKKYFLAPERSTLGCSGCSLVGKGKCTKKVTDYCTQGYILVEVK